MDKHSEGERRFRQLADSAPVLMWRADESMACDWVNRAWLEYTGRELEQELGFGWADGVHPDDRDGCVEAYRGAFARGEPFSLTYRLRRADGEYRWILDNGRPCRDERGDVVGCFGSCTDVHDMVKANEELSRVVKEREEAVAQRDHLLREVQHRVRNNLQLILSIIDMQMRAEPPSRPALAQVAGRVRSIAKAQALLLDPAGKAEIDLGEYLPSLAQGASAPETPVSVAAPRTPMMLPLSRAVPLGLMINEILMAISRHATVPLRIVMRHAPSDDHIEIEITSQGESAVESLDEAAARGAQSKLVQRLSAQAGARVENADGKGAVIVRVETE